MSDCIQTQWAEKPIANLKLKFLFRRGVARVGQAAGRCLVALLQMMIQESGWVQSSGILLPHSPQCSAISLDDGTLMARVISVTKQNTSNPILESAHTQEARGASQHSHSARTQNEMIGKDLSMRNHLPGTFFGCWLITLLHYSTDVYQNQGH